MRGKYTVALIFSLILWSSPTIAHSAENPWTPIPSSYSDLIAEGWDDEPFGMGGVILKKDKQRVICNLTIKNGHLSGRLHTPIETHCFKITR